MSAAATVGGGTGGSGAQIPLAFVRGEPYSDPPPSLYIPRSALRVRLDDFEGPLDLLLFLVRKNRFDILDIPMGELCRQYAEYAEEAARRDLELASDYLTMSAMLVEIKSRMLLPAPPAAEDAEADPRADLVRRLLEYEKIRRAAEALAALPLRDRDFVSPSVAVEIPAARPQKPSLTPLALGVAYAALLERAKIRAPYEVTMESVSMREVMSDILRRLGSFLGGIGKAGGRIRSVGFFRLLSGPRRVGVTLSAVLQLAMDSVVRLRQENPDAELLVEKREDAQ